MNTHRTIILTLRALLELARYDLVRVLRGFAGVYDNALAVTGTRHPRSETEQDICQAVERAACLYWKRVRCLQRSAATARLLRRHGISSELVVGYRLMPFFSHAWVEVGGRVVNDHKAYRERLQILTRIK